MANKMPGECPWTAAGRASKVSKVLQSYFYNPKLFCTAAFWIDERKLQTDQVEGPKTGQKVPNRNGGSLRNEQKEMNQNELIFVFSMKIG